MLRTDVEPTGVLIYCGIAESCILAFDTQGVIGRRTTLVDFEVIREGRDQWVLNEWDLRCQSKGGGGSKRQQLEELHSEMVYNQVKARIILVTFN